MSILSFLGKVGKGIVENIPVVGGIVSNAMNAKAQNRINEQNIQYAREAYSRERADSLSDWHMQNAYNDPASQMDRLKNAGLNPNLVYGNGADAQMGAPVRASKQQLPNLQAPDYGSVVSNALGAMQARANIARTEAETERIRQGTALGQFELKAKQEIGQSEFTKQMLAKTRAMTSNDTKQVREFEEWLNTAFSTAPDGGITVDALGIYPSSGSKFVKDTVTSATKKAIMEIENLKSGITLRNQQFSINEAQKIIMQAEAEFVKALGSKTGAGMALQLLRILFK